MVPGRAGALREPVLGRRGRDAEPSPLGFWKPEEQGESFVPNENGIALRVADVEAAVEEVRAAGGVVMGIEDSGVCHMGFVKDPDGNVLILHRRYAPKVRRDQG